MFKKPKLWSFYFFNLSFVKHYLFVTRYYLAKLPDFDCGTYELQIMTNNQAIIIPFNKKFSKPPIIAIGGSAGNISITGSAEGGYISDVTKDGFTYNSIWEQGIQFVLHWIAISL